MRYFKYIVFFCLSTLGVAEAKENRLTSRPNPFGGQNYYKGAKHQFSTRQNIFGGYNYNGSIKGSSRASIHGGYNYQYRVKK